MAKILFKYLCLLLFLLSWIRSTPAVATGFHRGGGEGLGVLVVENRSMTSSRGQLAELLYQSGVQEERSGNAAGALRLWALAYNFDPRRGLFLERFEGAHQLLLTSVRKKYEGALYDLEYGRVDRARQGLQSAHDLLDGLDPELDMQISRALTQ